MYFALPSPQDSAYFTAQEAIGEGLVDGIMAEVQVRTGRAMTHYSTKQTHAAYTAARFSSSFQIAIGLSRVCLSYSVVLLSLSAIIPNASLLIRLRLVWQVPSRPKVDAGFHEKG